MKKFFLFLLFIVHSHIAFAVDVQISQLLDSPDPVTRGGNITYSISLLNGSNDTANDVTLSIPLPASTTFVSVDDANCAHDGGTPGNLSCNFGNITGDGLGSPVTNVDLIVATSAATGNTVALTATVGTSSVDSNAANDSSTQNTTVDDGADLNVVLSDTIDPVIAGGVFFYNVDVNNIGPNDADDITVVNTLPSNITFISSSGAGWSCGDVGQVVTCTRAIIVDGASAPTIALEVQVTGAVTGTITNTVNVSASTGDPSLSNNTTTEGTVINQGTDLSISKAVEQPVVGSTTTNFTLSPRNLGPFDANTVSISDTLPAGFTYINATGVGWTCGNVGLIVTCDRATYIVGATDDIIINTNVPASGTGINNTADISSATADPDLANNSGSVVFSIVPDGANLSISKNKTPDPVALGANMISSIRVSNSGPNDTSGTITVVDTLDANETYASFTGTNWNCVEAPVGTVTCDYGLTIINGASSSILNITTTANAAGSLSNTACVSDNLGEVDAVPGNDCATDSALSTTDIADLAITKTVSTVGGTNDTLEVNENTVTYVLTATNTGDDVVDTFNAVVDNAVVIEDSIPAFVSGDTAINATVTGGTQQNFTCNIVNANVTCILNDGETFGGTLGSGADTVEITITADRGLFDGNFVNTANIRSEILGENNLGDNSDSVNITIDPVVDVEMQSLVISPNPSLAGTEVTYVLTYRNNGPSSALNVDVSHLFGPPVTRTYEVISSDTSQGACLALVGNTINCNIGTLTRNQSETITFVIQPGWDGANNNWALANTSTISTTSTESNAGNNSISNPLNVEPAELDLLINNVDLVDPVGWTPTPDVFPGVHDNVIIYKIDITNRGPSLATDVVLEDTFTPKDGKQLTFLCDDAAATGCNVGTSVCDNLGSSVTGNVGGTAQIETDCNLADMDPNTSTTRYLYFQAISAPDAIGDTHHNDTVITSNEDDSNPANDTEGETTSVRVLVDLGVTKNPSLASVSINEPFDWNLVINNLGPGDSANSQLSDDLPAGMELTGAPVPSQGSCTGVNGDVSFSCSLGDIINGANSTITVPVRVITMPGAGTISNTAEVTSFGVDSDGSNDTDTGTVTVTKSSISGTVFNDQNDNGAINVSEHGIENVTVTLSGNDIWGNPINSVQVTDVDGNYIFDNLPPGTNYLITETHPTNFADGLDSQNGVLINNSRSSDNISSINLPVNTALTQYNFAEIGLASIAGSVWHDENNDGNKTVDETIGIENVTITLTGNETVSGKAITFTTVTDSNGNYQFSNLAAGTYVVTETHPTNYADGTEQLGDAGGAAGNDVFSAINLASNQSGVGYNFGELGASISGTVYRDVNNDGVIDGSEARIENVRITLTGNDNNGFVVNEVVFTDVNGDYNFTGLPASNGTGYTITETQPTLIFDGLDTIGSLGGTLGNDVLSDIVIAANGTGIDYNFGEGADIRSSISGTVFSDLNNNAFQEQSEIGIEGVRLNLTGTNSLGQVVSRTAWTNPNGNYIFSGLVSSNQNGYTITEIQPENYLDGLDTNQGVIIVESNLTDVITGIILNDDENIQHNNFAELFVGNITGAVFVDHNDNGIQEPNEPGIPNVSLTLTGKNALANNIQITVQTDSNGDYIFSNLMDSNSQGYTVTQTQPQDYNDGLDSKLGIVIDSSRTTDAITGIIINNGTSAINNDFGELYKASLSGTVYIDTENGLLDPDEIGIEGVTLNLTGTDAFNNPVNLTVTTNALGQYFFSQIPPSDNAGYTLTEIQPNSYADGQESIGNQVITDSHGTDTISDILVTLNSELTDYNFAELLTGSISGYVFNDKNNNGIKTSDEASIENVTLTLTGVGIDGQSVEQTVVTDEQGFYQFNAVVPSNEQGYTITETQPNNFQDGLESIANVPLQNSNLSDVIDSVNLLTGDDLTDYNFGEVDSASISGYVWIDENNNGILDNNETLRVPNTTITLIGVESELGEDNTPTNITKTTTTNDEGFYIFEGLLNGTYQIAQVQPIAWLDGKDQLGNLGGNASNDLFETITLIAGQQGENYNFGELGSSIQGFVYSDLNDNGIKETNEAGIPNVEINITGTDINGQPIERTTFTTLSGQYIFEHLPLPNAQGYTITETQPEQVNDGKDTVGSIGGNLANDVISEIVFDSHLTQASGYNFGEQLQNPAQISGTVWLDDNHNKINDEGDGLAGWTVELIESRTDPKVNTNIMVIATLITDNDGNYLFDGLSPGEYEVRFIHPQGGVIYGYPVSDEPGVDLTAGTIRQITLEAGEHIDEQNLPIDPSGIIYNSQTREPVAGATVTLTGPAGFDPSKDLIGGEANVVQVTGDDGIYQYLLFDTAPAGVYELTVVEPPSYLPGISSQILPCTNTPEILTSPNPALVQLENSPPPISATLHDENTCGTTSADFSEGENSTQYYLSFDITPLLPSANVINNHIPVDPLNSDLFSVIKTSTTKNATRGDLVPYDITITNNQNTALTSMSVIDQLPPGFKYIQGSAKIEGVAIEPIISGQNLTWENINFAPFEKQVLSLIAVIGSGVSEGEYVNQAWVADMNNDIIVANVGTATIRIVPDSIFDCSDITGKVFNDENANGYQDEGEKGLPAIRLVTAQGLLITTDQHGRYHIACSLAPNEMRGSNFIIKLDDRTLPSGFRITTENPKVVRLTRGKTTKADFGATIHRVIRIQLNDLAFERTELKQEFNKPLEQAIEKLRFGPSVLRLAYVKDQESDLTIDERLEALTKTIEETWEACDCHYELMIEREVTLKKEGLIDLDQVKEVGHE